MTRTVSAREPYLQSPGYIHRDVAYNTLGIGAANTVLVGVLPAGAKVTKVNVDLIAAFNAGSTNVLIVGTADNDDAFVAAGDFNEAGTPGVGTDVATGLGTRFTADTPVYAKYTQTGTAATTGQAGITIEYVRTSDP